MEEYGFTVEENELLNMLAAGELDGVYDTMLRSKDGGSAWIAIVAGIPAFHIEQPVIRKVVNGELIHMLGKTLELSIWNTEERKLEFLRFYGSCIDNPQVMEYADKPVTKKPLLIRPLTAERLHRVYNFDIAHFDS